MQRQNSEFKSSQFWVLIVTVECDELTRPPCHWQATRVDRAGTCCCCCYWVSVAHRLSTIMLWCTNEVVFACGMSNDESDGSVFGMWHWRVGGNIHRKFQPLSLWSKTSKFGRNRHGALVSSCSLSALASQHSISWVTILGYTLNVAIQLRIQNLGLF